MTVRGGAAHRRKLLVVRVPVHISKAGLRLPVTRGDDFKINMVPRGK